ncbi:MAG: hypothetical protein RIB59_04870, partial [Rhodospirillales bacterium]
QKQRAGRLPVFLSKAVVAFHYLLYGGVFTDWRAGTKPFWRPLADTFKPDVVWGIFGNTDAWAIAQGIAREAGCPWVRDIKDQWTAFIPAPFRNVLARRFGDAAAATALSQANADAAAPWFGAASVIYSGYPPELDSVTQPAPPENNEAPFTLVLVGATYNQELLNGLVEGLTRFLDTAERGPVELVYAGTDAASASRALAPLQGRLRVDIHNQLSLPDFSRLIQGAHANLYVRMPKSGWWHHKIVELLAARRPIVCYPGEIDEAKRMAESVGGRLENPATPDALAQTLERLWRDRTAPQPAEDSSRLKSLGWPYRADRLAETLGGACRKTA